MNTSRPLPLLLFITILFLSATPAMATFVPFEDRTAFINAAAGAGLTATNEDFSTDPGDPFTLNDGNGNSLSLGLDPTATQYNGTLELLDSPPIFNLVQLDSAGFSGQVHGLGFDFSVDQAEQIQIEIVSEFLHSQANSLGPLTGFFGVLSTDGMDLAPLFPEIRVASEGSVAQLDNLVIITPVPVPSAMLLFGTGLAGFVGWRWWSTKHA